MAPVQEQHQGRRVARVDGCHDVADHLGELLDVRELHRCELVVVRGDRVGPGVAGIVDQRTGRRCSVGRPVGAAGRGGASPAVEDLRAEHDVVRRRVGRCRGRDDHRDGAGVGAHVRRDQRPVVADLDRCVGRRDGRRGVPGQPVAVSPGRRDRPLPELAAPALVGGGAGRRAQGDRVTRHRARGTRAGQAEEDATGRESGGTQDW